jgi:plasmid maintenance system antidote protein VapI
MRRPRAGHPTRVSQAVADAIKASGLTLRGFADKLGLSAAYISDLQRGHRPLSREMALRLSTCKPKWNVRHWLLLQLDDDIDALKQERQRVVRASPPGGSPQETTDGLNPGLSGVT